MAALVLTLMLFLSNSALAQSVWVDAVQGGKLLETTSDGKLSELSDRVTRSAGSTFSTSNGQSARLILEDGTELLLSQNSAVTVNAKKSVETQSAYLRQGTVKVQVPSQEKKEADDDIKVERVNSEKPYRFFMQTRYVVLGVRGTEFLVDYDSKNQQTEVHTLDGIVDAGRSSKALKMGERTMLSENHSIQARAEKIDAPRAFDRDAYTKQIQTHHPQMMKVMSAPLHTQSEFKGMQIRREFIKQHGEPSTLKRQDLMRPSQRNSEKGQHEPPRPPTKGASQQGVAPSVDRGHQHQAPMGEMRSGQPPEQANSPSESNLNSRERGGSGGPNNSSLPQAPINGAPSNESPPMGGSGEAPRSGGAPNSGPPPMSGSGEAPRSGGAPNSGPPPMGGSGIAPRPGGAPNSGPPPMGGGGIAPRPGGAPNSGPPPMGGGGGSPPPRR